MKQAKGMLPTVIDTPRAKLQAAPWGGMMASFATLSPGMDFKPLFKGLKDDLCQCPHWGYVLEGAVHVRYGDGSSEVVQAGEQYYFPAGHSLSVEQTTRYVQFSPEPEMSRVLGHCCQALGLTE